LEKRERGHIHGQPNFLGYPLLWKKLQTSHFVCIFTVSIGTKSNEKCFTKSSQGHSQAVRKIFRAPIYRAHCAVIFAIAQLSCSFYKHRFTALQRTLFTAFSLWQFDNQYSIIATLSYSPSTIVVMTCIVMYDQCLNCSKTAGGSSAVGGRGVESRHAHCMWDWEGTLFDPSPSSLSSKILDFWFWKDRPIFVDCLALKFIL